MHINKIHKIDGVNLVKPSDIFAKLFEAIPNEIPIAKKIYPSKGFMNYYLYIEFNLLFLEATCGELKHVPITKIGKIETKISKNPKFFKLIFIL